MKTQGKRFRAAETKVDKTREYPVSEAAKILKDAAFAKFNETVSPTCTFAAFASWGWSTSRRSRKAGSTAT